MDFVHGSTLTQVKSMVRRAVPMGWITIAFLSLATALPAYTETVYRTGLQAERGHLAVSPDGKRLAFTTNRLAHGMRLLDTDSGLVTQIPTQPGRNIGFPSWAPDGRSLVAISADTHTGYYNRDDMRIVLLDTKTWQERILANSGGVKFDPVFSPDGKTIYYFKGKKRKQGKTPASNFDLFAVDIESGREQRLTHEEYYLISMGDADGNNVLFEGEGGGTLPEEKGPHGLIGHWPTLLKFDIGTSALTMIRVDHRSELFNFSNPKRDKAGNLYFIAAKLRPGGGNYLWYLANSAPDGSNAKIVTELPISMEFCIARNTGAIFVMDRDGAEIILRKLNVTAAH
ncbi:TolB family protein [Propionivibrio dicarboxylicus]|uniref:WD40-like Beta Propeller Repeat n=1 Tax=Propionivibrio dicarboxylicus TaxID=83767 RepID=A0A1G8I1A5_9RHOO|nr:PD40 domain-containing protein [Propionivibrio dicarboxylicus]SDI12678.1 WD40-like Beta Propeller Repeat [Propionivibrio dicarboxylicus]